jgi:hypothetical protein
VVSILIINYGVLGAVSIDANAGHHDVAHTAFTHKGIQIIGKHIYQLRITLSRTVLRW